MRELLAAMITAGLVGWIAVWVWAGRRHPEMIRCYFLRPVESAIDLLRRHAMWVLIGGLVITGVLLLYAVVYAALYSFAT